MAPGDLQEVLSVLRRPALSAETARNLIVGLGAADDAAVYRISDDLALVETVDFFPPVVDDPWTWGAVAAANAMSDVYAMGGDVMFALAVAGFPREMDKAIIAEVFRGVTDGVWGDGENKEAKEGKRRVASSVIRRNLQREHLKKLFTLVLGERQPSGFFVILFGDNVSVPPDARSLARMHLRDIDKRIDAALDDKQAVVDDTTRAHLEECRERIRKVLNASMQVNEP